MSWELDSEPVNDAADYEVIGHGVSRINGFWSVYRGICWLV